MAAASDFCLPAVAGMAPHSPAMGKIVWRALCSYLPPVPASTAVKPGAHTGSTAEVLSFGSGYQDVRKPFLLSFAAVR